MRLDNKSLKTNLIIINLFLLSIFLFFQVKSHFNVINIIIRAIIPFVIAFVIAYCLDPLVSFVQNKFKIKRNISVGLVFLFFMLCITIFVLALLPLLIDQTTGLIEFIKENKKVYETEIMKKIEEFDIDIKKILDESKEVIFSGSVNAVVSGTSFLGNLFSILFMTPIFLIMLMFSFESIKNTVKVKIKETKKDLYNLIEQIDDNLGKYIRVTLIDCTIITIESFIFFKIFGINYALLFSLLVGVFNLIPFVGPFLSLIPIVLIVSIESIPKALIVLVVITIFQTIEANIVKPYLTSKSMSIHPITTLLVVLVGGSVSGILGAFVAVPVYIILKLFLNYYLKQKKIKTEK